jgi:hypothetical protein
MRDEQAETDNFESVCGGVQQAQRLFGIYKRCVSFKHPNPRYSKTKEEVFAACAKLAGYTPVQIQALLDCQ